MFSLVPMDRLKARIRIELHQIGAAVLKKKALLGGHENMLDLAQSSNSNRPMILIGG